MGGLGAPGLRARPDLPGGGHVGDGRADGAADDHRRLCREPWLTAVSSGVFRVTESGHGGAAVRDWRLSAGDSLTLRAGDRLTLAEGARVRFEAGKRIPGAAASGVAWAEPRTRGVGALAGCAGLAITLGGGAMVLIGSPREPASRSGAVAAPMVIVILVVRAASWGVYGRGSRPISLSAPRRWRPSWLRLSRAVPPGSVPRADGPARSRRVAVCSSRRRRAWSGRLDELAGRRGPRACRCRLLPALLGGGALLAGRRRLAACGRGRARPALRTRPGRRSLGGAAPGPKRARPCSAPSPAAAPSSLLALAPSIGPSGAAIRPRLSGAGAAPLAAGWRPVGQAASGPYARRGSGRAPPLASRRDRARRPVRGAVRSATMRARRLPGGGTLPQ